ncbi:uncharacterized protein LOC108630898 [Ceratina calcarata]|uniref:Uncharacterized protein LOC108630898 n=1 Tax=Ceratina calcarata TaxID=156304 RepID=A0AAJ7NDK5_9HYME|nr:uncharacterized protein LOC108630898 [Ceratina calcarata]
MSREKFVSVFRRSVNMDTDRDLKVALGWNRVNMRLVGIWPEPIKKNERWQDFKVLFFLMVISFFGVGPQTANLYFIGRDLQLVTENLSTANIPGINALMKLIFSWYYKNSFKPLVQTFYDDWRTPLTEEEKAIMMKGAKSGRLISVWCSALTLLMVTLYLSSRSYIVYRSDIQNEEKYRLLLYPGYVPYDIRRVTLLIFANVGQVVAGYSAVIYYTTVDTFIAMLVIHLTGQFQILRNKLEKLMGDENGDRSSYEIQQELVSIVKRHEHLNWSASKIDNCFSTLLLIQMLLCTIELCLQGFYFFKVILRNENGLLSVDFAFFITFVCFILVHIFIYCYIGDMLIVECKELSDSVYKSNWFNVSPPNQAKQILFIMTRSTRPLSLTAGKFGTFSMEMFSTILKTAMGYMSVLLTVSDRILLTYYISLKISRVDYCNLQQREMEFAMGWNRYNLTLLGVWPEPRETSSLSRFLSNLIFWFGTVVTVTFICAPQTAYLVLRSSSLDEAIENLSVNVPIAFAVVKQAVLWYRKKALALLVSQILDDWREPIGSQDRETMLKNAKLSRITSIVCSFLTYFLLVTFISLQVWNNMQNTSEADLGGLLHPAMFPYDTQKSPNFEITWLGQFIGTVLTAICYSSFDTFLAVLVLHLCGQITVLRVTLESLARKQNDSSKFFKDLGLIVDRHDQLFRFAIIVEDCFNLTLLVQISISTAMFCLTGYRIIKSLDEDEQPDGQIVGLAFFLIHVIYTMLHLFIYCYVGEMLLEQSTGVAESAYDCNWHDLSPRQALSLVIVMCRARAAFQLTAGKFRPFSLELFNAILKTSAGYLSVLLAMKDRLD